MTNPNIFAPLCVPERSIPVPASIGPEAQAILGKAGEAAIVWPDFPALEDVKAWLAWVEAATVNLQAMLDATAEPGDDQASIELVHLGEFNCYRAVPTAVSGGGPDKILLYLHGGALIAGGGEPCRTMAGRWAARTGSIVYAPDYRMPPLYPYPTPLDDCVVTYRHILARHAPEHIVVQGASAGGNLAAALILRATAEDLPLPAGLILETPELDLTESGDTFQTNAFVDVVLQRGLGQVNRLYAGSHDLAHPLLSPLFGDLSCGWPPTLITAGTRDLFLSNAARMLHRLRDADAQVELLVYEAMPHGGFFGTPEDRRLARDLAAFAELCWSANKTH